MPLPDFDNWGDLPPGVHGATLAEVVVRFGDGNSRRQSLTANLLDVYQFVQATGLLDRFLIFGSYVTAKPEPNDIDLFLVMAERFEVDDCTGDTRTVFAHSQAQQRFGASIFWVTRSTSQAGG
jgi:hypothetical protein